MDPVLHLRYSILTGCLALIAIVTLVQTFRDKSSFDGRVFRHWIVLALLAFVGSQLVAGASAPNQAEALFAVAKTVTKAALFLMLLYYLSKDNRLLMWICRATIICNLALSVMAIMQYTGVAFLTIPGNHLPYATMTNKNLLGSALFLMLPLVTFTWLTDIRSWRRVALIIVGIDILTIVLTQSRAVWLALAISTCFALVLLYWSHRYRLLWSKVFTAKRTVFSLMVVTIVALTVGFAMLAAVPDARRSSTLTLPINMSTSSLNQRLILWEKSLAIAQDHPLLGCGPGNWKLEVPAYGTQGLPSASGEVFFLRPHNEYLAVLSESGPMSLLCYLAFFGLAFFYGIRTLVRTQSATDGQISLLGLTGLVRYMVIAGFSFPEERAVHPMLVSLLLAVVTVSHHRSGQQIRGITPGRFILGCLLAALLLSANCVISLKRWQSEHHIKNAIVAQARQQWETVRDEASRAGSWAAQIDPATNPTALYLGVAYLAQQNCNSALPWFEAAYKIHPHHIQLLNNYAYCLHTSGELDSAKDFYHQALNLSPLPETMINLAILYNQIGRPDSARIWLDNIPYGTEDERIDLLRNRLESTTSESN